MSRLTNTSRAVLWALCVAGLTLVAAEEERCPPGTYVNGTDCVPCPIGTFQPETTTTEDPKVCRSCTPGYYCSRSRLSAPEGLCQDGFYCPQGSTRKEGLSCPANFYCELGSSAPVPCPQGKKSAPGTGDSSGCKEAYYAVCPPGQYFSYSKCSNCPSGTFQPSWMQDGSINCQPCPAGQFCAVPGQAAPSGPCVFAGYYCPMRSISPTSQLCPRGFYCPANNMTPIRCPEGTTSSPGAKDISGCLKVSESITCPPGMYKNRSKCAPCPVGKYQPKTTSVEGIASCKPCDPGKYCKLPRASSVSGSCQAGYYCPEGSTVANENLCPEGHYCLTGTGTPRKCPPGKTSDKGETTSVNCRSIFEGVNCGPGTYTDSTSGCEDCPAGTYQPGWSHGKGSYICVYCEEGKYCERPGLTAPSGSCALGYYCPIRSTKPTQQLCPTDHYCPTSNVTIRCPPGTTSIAGSNDVAECTVIDIIECSAGYYRVGLTCAPCPEGTYKASAGVRYEACSPCPAGSYCLGLGNTASTECPGGYYCPAGSNSSTAYLCPEDHFCQTGRSYPSSCGNSERSYPGSDSPIDCDSYLPRVCPNGQYTIDGYCYKCPAGYYKPVSDRAGVDSCLVCPAGSYCPPGSVNPAGKCTGGYFCPQRSQQPKSIICPADHFCPEGSGVATPCPPGKESPPGSSSC